MCAYAYICIKFVRALYIIKSTPWLKIKIIYRMLISYVILVQFNTYVDKVNVQKRTKLARTCLHYTK